MDKNEGRSDLVTLVDEEGNEHDFMIVDFLQIKTKQYALLMPLAQDDNDTDDANGAASDEAFVFRLDEVNGEEILVPVEEETEWSLVAAEWDKKIKALEEQDED